MNKKIIQNKEIIKGGGVIFREGVTEKEILLIKTSTRGFSFPKGHLEENETIKECALRECQEETGLELKIIKKLPDLFFTKIDTGEHFIDNYYLMEVIGGKLTKENLGDELKWIPLSKVKDAFIFKNRRDYIERNKGLIE